MKGLKILFILIIVFSCKTINISDNSIVGVYKHGYTYPLNDYGLAEHDSIFIDLKADHTFKYDRYLWNISYLDHDKTSYGKWQLKGNKIILNSQDKKLKLNIDTVSSLPKKNVPKLRFSFDFNNYIGGIFEDRVNIELDKSFNLFLCENSKYCFDLNKNSNFKTKLSVNDPNNNVVTYERLLNLNIFNVLSQGREYYFEVRINDKILKKHSYPIYRKSIRSESFTFNGNQHIDEISFHLQKYDDDFFNNEQDLDFYPLTNVKIHINKNNELKLKKRKLFKADSIFRYNWESKDEYNKSMGW